MEEEFEEREPELPAPTRVLHIKKRALKNKSLAVSFDEKNLRDYVTGFHKRKKKRRKEAQKQQEEVLRRKRIEARKKRKQEREFALYGGAPPTGSDDNEEPNASDEDYHSDGEEGEPSASVNATKTYDGSDIKVTVTTSEIFREDEVDAIKKTQSTLPKSREDDKKLNLAVSKKKSFKKVSKHKVRGKPRNSKTEKKKGKKKGNKR